MSEMTTHTTGGVPAFELRHRLALALEHANLKPEDIAVELGLGVTTIRNYLHARTSPRRAVLMAWALRCEVSLEWLETGTTTGPSPDDGGSTQDEESSACTPLAQVVMLRSLPVDRDVSPSRVAA